MRPPSLLWHQENMRDSLDSSHHPLALEIELLSTNFFLSYHSISWSVPAVFERGKVRVRRDGGINKHAPNTASCIWQRRGFILIQHGKSIKCGLNTGTHGLHWRHSKQTSRDSIRCVREPPERTLRLTVALFYKTIMCAIIGCSNQSDNEQRSEKSQTPGSIVYCKWAKFDFQGNFNMP